MEFDIEDQVLLKVFLRMEPSCYPAVVVETGIYEKWKSSKKLKNGCGGYEMGGEGLGGVLRLLHKKLRSQNFEWVMRI